MYVCFFISVCFLQYLVFSQFGLNSVCILQCLVLWGLLFTDGPFFILNKDITKMTPDMNSGGHMLSSDISYLKIGP